MSFALPLFLVPVEWFLAYPYIVEEVAKAVVIYLFRSYEQTGRQLKAVFFGGILFTFSESGLYLSNVAQDGVTQMFFARLLIVGLLHVLTYFIIYTFSRRWWVVLGVIIAIVIHYMFNFIISGSGLA